MYILPLLGWLNMWSRFMHAATFYIGGACVGNSCFHHTVHRRRRQGLVFLSTLLSLLLIWLLSSVMDAWHPCQVHFTCCWLLVDSKGRNSDLVYLTPTTWNSLLKGSLASDTEGQFFFPRNQESQVILIWW